MYDAGLYWHRQPVTLVEWTRSRACLLTEPLSGRAPLLGLEYLVEHPPEQAHYEPSYMCTLCSKQGHPRTIINHMTCFWHRYNYLVSDFSFTSSFPLFLLKGHLYTYINYNI